MFLSAFNSLQIGLLGGMTKSERFRLKKKKKKHINHSSLYSLCQDKHSTACVFDYNYRGNYYTKHEISEKQKVFIKAVCKY